MLTHALARFLDHDIPLAEAAHDLFSELGIVFGGQVTRLPINFADHYRRRLNSDPPKALADLLPSVENTFLVGLTAEQTLDDYYEDAQQGQCNGILCFALEIKDNARPLTRTQGATLCRAFNRIALANPVLLIIRWQHTLHLALCERSDYTQQWRQGKKLGKVRILMDIDCRQPHRGHLDLLQEIAKGKGQCNTFDQLYQHWLNVFSVSTLNDRFYHEIEHWYFWAASIAQFPNDTTRNDDYQAHNDEALIRLITRLIFVWFLKVKGLVNPDLFNPTSLAGILKNFDPQSTTCGNFYNAILQNLFFATLNQEIDARQFVQSFQKGYSPQHTIKTFYRGIDLFQAKDEQTILQLFAQTPYVNGSLFECLDGKQGADGHTYNYDGFSTHKLGRDGVIKRALLPNLLFFAPQDSQRADLYAIYNKESARNTPVSGLIDILARYHFTIEESTPLDEQIALDPELLGRVFENLLGAYNPETQKNARNSTGSFYTPREVVDYMARQSLLAYFRTRLPHLPADSLEALLDEDDTNQPLPLDDQQTSQLLEAVYHCRILDPACGSGAFPMGLLHLLTRVLRKLDPNNTNWQEIIKKQALQATDKALDEANKKEREKRLENIKNTFNRQQDHPDYTRKLYVLEQCIHGVDIQPVAMMISKLRFFVSLLCEQQTNDKPEDNYGILPMPNLETKLVAANSLVQADIRNFQDNDWTLDNDIAALKEQLIDLRRKHIAPRNKQQKLQMEQRDRELCLQISNTIIQKQTQPDQQHIAEYEAEIQRQRLIIEKQLQPEMKEVAEPVQTNLFGEAPPPTQTKLIIDINSEKRLKAERTIRNCQDAIDKENNKQLPQGYEAAVMQLTHWDPYDQNASSPFFDPEWMFGINEGFDIVIGNPPYLQVKKGTYSANLFPYSEGKDEGKQNLYKVFVEHGYNTCAANGIVCMIVQESLMCDMTATATRELLLTKTDLQQIIHFPKNTDDPELRVFKNVLTGTCIVLFLNHTPDNDTFIVSIHNNLQTIKFLQFTTLSQLSILNGKRNLEIPLLKQGEGALYMKMKTQFRMLSDLLIGSRQGNINTIYLDKIRSFTQTSIRIGKGDRIHRYHLDIDNMMFAKETESNYKLVNDNKIGDFVVTQNISGTVDTWRLHACRAVCKKTNIVFLHTTNIVYLSCPREAILVVGLLNSRLLDWTFRTTSTNNHVNIYELEALPIPSAEMLASPTADKLVELVKRAESGEDVQDKIDRLVCDLYGLSPEERAVLGVEE